MHRIDLAIAFVLGLTLAACGPGVGDPGATMGGDGGSTQGASGDERGDGPGGEGGRDEGRDGDADGGSRDGGHDDTADGGEGEADEGGPGGDPDDPNSGAAIRNCFECWEDNAGECQEARACYDSLACTQLLDCPFACEDPLECLAECNEIIPSGVAPLTAAIQCMVCSGGPCALDCQNDLMLSYCG